VRDVPANLDGRACLRSNVFCCCTFRGGSALGLPVLLRLIEPHPLTCLRLSFPLVAVTIVGDQTRTTAIRASHPSRVSLEVNEDGTPKSPREALDDGLPKFYIHHNGFLKVLGATVDVNADSMTPILYDREGFEMDPNA
jgi:hypothetical protein